MELTIDAKALEREGVRLVVTFGSRVRGTPRGSSDLDVGVLFGSTVGISLERLDAIRAALAADAAIDLVPLDLADPLLLYEVAVDGRPVYECEPGAWEEYRIVAVKRYYDTAWIREIESAALRRRLKDG
jgi:predicted nucleotidyltransferase